MIYLEERGKKLTRVYKCFECKWNVSVDDAIYENKHYYHPACYALVLDKKNFVEYVCKLFGLKAPGPVIYSQRKNFMEKYKYTDAGMVKTLKFLYEVQKNKIDNAQERIGLIPYAYDEAQEHYAKEDERKRDIANKMSNAIKNQKIEKIRIRKIPKKERKVELIDPNTILAMKDEE